MLTKTIFILKYCISLLGFAKLLGVNIGDLKPVKLLGLGIVVLSVFLVSFGPFIWLVSRLSYSN